MLLVDSDSSYRFTHVDIGHNSRISDGGVYKDDSFYNELNYSTYLSHLAYLILHTFYHMLVIVADDAFAIRSYLVRPYRQNYLTKEKRIFNCRLSRGSPCG